MRIRQATEDDIETLLAYADALFAEGLPGIYRRATPTLEEEREFVRAHSEPENSILLVAEEDGAVVGLLGFRGRELAEERHVGAFGLSVAQGWRGRGIGTALVETLLDWAPEHGISRIEVEAFSSNPDAVRLYKRLGFKEEGLARRAIIRDGQSIDVHRLARLLS